MGIEVAAYAALAVSAVSAVKQQQAAGETASAQKKQQRLAQKQADIKASRARYAAIRQSRIAQAETTAAAEAGGVLGTSGLAGGLGSAQTQLAVGVGESLQLQGMSQRQSIFAQQQADAQSTAATWGAIGGVAGTIFQGAGGYKTIFKETV